MNVLKCERHSLRVSHYPRNRVFILERMALRELRVYMAMSINIYIYIYTYTRSCESFMLLKLVFKTVNTIHLETSTLGFGSH